MTLYEILGVSPDASRAVIKTAYRRLAQAHHPDKGGDPAKFREIQQAYDVLSDSERRARYDATGNSEDVLSPEEQKAQARRAKALQTIRKLFAKALNDSDETTTDLLESARKLLAAAHKDISEQVAQYQARRDKAVSAASRVTDTDNVLAPLLQSLADEATTIAAAGEEELLMVTLAVAILDSGTYRIDKRSQEDIDNEAMRVSRMMFEQLGEQMKGMYGTRFRFNPGP